MGFLDDMQASLNRTTAGASRAMQASKIRSQMSDALKRRQQLAAQLGASLYDATRENDEFRCGREALYDGIAAIDAERVQCEAQLEALDREAAAEAQAAQTYECPFCHSRIAATDMFCSGCGKPMAEIQAPAAAPAASGETCPSCGAPVNSGDAFCMNCGSKIG